MNRHIAVLMATIVAAFSPAAVAAAATTKTYRGTAVNMKFGPVTVKIGVRGKKIVSVSAVLPTERPRSQRINSQAGPLLRKEVLSAQSAHIHVISGATYTSNAYAQSLQAALDKAHL
jgi:uncharacterized protein with FMN-binding domain